MENYLKYMRCILKNKQNLGQNTIKTPGFDRNSRIKPDVLMWWEEVDSNHRSRRRQIYSLIHLAALESSRMKL